MDTCRLLICGCELLSSNGPEAVFFSVKWLIHAAMNVNQPVPPGIVTKASGHSVQETLDRLERIIHEKGLVTFAVIDHSGEAEKAGLKMDEAKLVVFGSPRAGTPLMIASPLIALDLPLKALVWKNKEGKVLVSYNSVSYLASRFNLPSDLTKNIAGLDTLIDSALSD
jgi:uncharacterized protein (DUF302 family)